MRPTLSRSASSRHGLRLVIACLAMAAPTVLAADDAPLTDDQFRAAYCSGYAEAVEQAIGDTCIDANAGWENSCSTVIRQKERGLALLTAENAINNPGVGPAIALGLSDYRQCITQVSSGGAAACARLTRCQE